MIIIIALVLCALFLYQIRNKMLFPPRMPESEKINVLPKRKPLGWRGWAVLLVIVLYGLAFYYWG